MTAPKTQIQALINKIDEVLQASESTRKRSPNPQEDIHQQQVLEQARNYLASLQGTSSQGQRDPLAGGSLNMGESPSLPVINSPNASTAAPGAVSAVPSFNAGMVSPAESAQQVLQAVVQEMNYLRVNMMQPLREELMTLYQQRQMLTADIKRLEQQRYQLMLANQQFNQQKMIEEFLQSLMGRLQEQLASQVAQTYANLELHAAQLPSADQAADYPQLTPGQRLQHLQHLQATSDEVMLKLDSTLRVVFDSLQTNVESYQDSLSQGLEKMHGLGQQGEAMFAALVNRFAQHLGRGASYYLQSSLQKEWELPGLGTVEGGDSGLTPKTPVQSEDQVSVPDKLPDDQLNRMIGFLADDEARGESVDAAESSAAMDEGLIDELLDVLGADASQGSNGIDFNLDDIDLAGIPGAESEGDVSADAMGDGALSDITAMMGIAGIAGERGDRPYVPEDELTLFEIGDEGVRVHLDEERITHIEEADTDDFLNELDALTSSEEGESQVSSPEMPDSNGEDSQGVGGVPGEDLGAIAAPDFPAVMEEDEALTFLDQVATEMEQDLGSEISSSEISDATDEFYQMFTSATEASGLGQAPDGDDASAGGDIPETAEDSDFSDGEGASGEGLLSGLFDVPDDLVSLVSDDAWPDTILNDLSGDALLDKASGESGEVTSEANDDLWSELGVTVQGVPVRQDGVSQHDIQPVDSERVETITSLVDLVDDENVRASLQAAIRSSSADATGGKSTSGATGDRPEDRYVVASPDEDLLMADDVVSQGDMHLSLDDSQRQQLASDLAKVEGLDTSDILGHFDLDFAGIEGREGQDTASGGMASGDMAPIEPPEGETLDEFAALGDALSPRASEPPVMLEGFSNMPAASGNDPSDSGIPTVDDAETLEGFFENASPAEGTLNDLFEDADDAPSPEGYAPSPVVFSNDNRSDAAATSPASLTPQHTEPTDTDRLDMELVEHPKNRADTGSLSGTETVRERFESSDQNRDNEPSDPSLDMTVESLFSTVDERRDNVRGGDRPDEEFINPFDTDDELRGIFEDLQAFNEADAEESQVQEEKTLMDLMKGFNQPTLPSEDSSSGNETDTSWTIFDDVSDGDADTSGQNSEKKN